jgi:hypothetical protein
VQLDLNSVRKMAVRLVDEDVTARDQEQSIVPTEKKAGRVGEGCQPIERGDAGDSEENRVGHRGSMMRKA